MGTSISLIPELPGVKVFNNFLTPSYLKHIYHRALMAEYVFINSVSYAEDDDMKPTAITGVDVFEVGQFSKGVIASGDASMQDLEMFTLLEPYLFQVYDSNPEIIFSGVHRAKFNLLVERPDRPELACTLPHADVRGLRGYSALLYLHDADGDTVFFNERRTPECMVPTAFTEAVRIKPTANTLVFFPSHIFHASSNPRFGGNRHVLNVVFDAV